MIDSGSTPLIIIYASRILDAKCEKVNIEDYATAQTHLNKEQTSGFKLLLKHEKIFSDKLGFHAHKRFNIELYQGQNRYIPTS